jgi:hypothetical protein
MLYSCQSHHLHKKNLFRETEGMSVSSSDFLIKSSAEDGLEGPIMVQIGSLFPGMVFDSDLQSLGSTPEVLD